MRCQFVRRGSPLLGSEGTNAADLLADGEEIDGLVEVAVLEEEGGALGDQRRIRRRVEVVGDQLQRTELLRLEGQLQRLVDQAGLVVQHHCRIAEER